MFLITITLTIVWAVFLQHAHQLVHHLAELLLVDPLKELHAVQRGDQLLKLVFADVPVARTGGKQQAGERLLGRELGTGFQTTEQRVEDSHLITRLLGVKV